MIPKTTIYLGDSKDKSGARRLAKIRKIALKQRTTMSRMIRDYIDSL